MYCRDAYEKKISSKKKPSKPKKMKKPVPIGDVSIASSCQFIFIILKSYRTRFNPLSCNFLAHHGTLTQNYIKIPPSRRTNQSGPMCYKNQRNKQHPYCHKNIGWWWVLKMNYCNNHFYYCQRESVLKWLLIQWKTQ